ncbi:unnamed protein product [Symbiodinium pilosum]|uniref:Uncharacterized protein n=1 Tax=Symbiodinium pilosum TaxID=2952 RepID=A0A812V5V7_SYMPI|nr:unnamed protein product [Symbiodinium pilosum]
MLEQWQSLTNFTVAKQVQSFFGLETDVAELPPTQETQASPMPSHVDLDSQQPPGKEDSKSRVQAGDGRGLVPEETGHTGAFSSLLSGDATLSAPDSCVEEPSEFASDSAQHKIQQSSRPMYMPDMRMDEEDLEDQHPATPFLDDASDDNPVLDALPAMQMAEAEELPYWLQLSSEGLVSQWAPFSSYTGTDTNLSVRPAPQQEEAIASLQQTIMPEGFQVISVRHQESLSDPSIISAGKYFYFDAAAYPSYEFSSHPCLVEQWRGAVLVWSGAVSLSLGALAAVDMPAASTPAVGRKEPRQASQPGDFEVDDVISVVGFHRNLIVSLGKHMDFPENLLGYQGYCVGKRALPQQDFSTETGAKYADELGDLGKRMQINIEVDERELLAIRGATESRASMGCLLEPAAHVENTNTAANELARENSLVLAGIEVAEEGSIPHNIRSSASTEGWTARRHAILNARPRHVPDREATL